MKVYIVDDDPLVRSSLELQLEAASHDATGFASSLEFLRLAPSLVRGCVFLDIRMPEIDGLTVQDRLVALNLDFPIVMITGHGDVGSAVRAMKAGAIDFLEKPFSAEAVRESLRVAEQQLAAANRPPVDDSVAAATIAKLSRRERQVLDGLIEGLPNKTIGWRLGISPRTVELHRAHLMEKTHARSLSELVRLAVAAGIDRAPTTGR